MSVTIPAGRINRLFGTDGGVMLSLYADFPAQFDTGTPLLVTIDALEVPLYCERFERRGTSGAVASFADFDTERRAQELVGLEFRIECDEDEDDEEECYATTCPECEEEVYFDETVLEDGEVVCPNCGAKLEFDLSDLAAAAEDGEDEEALFGNRHGAHFGEALFKSQLAAGSRLPERGSVFISVRECDKPKAVVCAHQLHQAGFPLVATAGTAHVIQQAGIPCRTVGRIGDAAGDVIGMMEAGDITLVIMSVAEHEGELNDARAIRKLALAKQITYYIHHRW